MFNRDTYGGYGRSTGFSWGVALVAIGLMLLFLRILAPTGALPLLFLGGVFTAISFGRGLRGFLVPGGILVGLGTGVIAATVLSHLSGAFGGAAVIGGLGAGFWSIHLIERARNPFGSGFAWARIPGTVLLGFAAFLTFLGSISVGFKALGLLFSWWPLLLIVGGLWIFFASRRRPASY